MARELEEAVPIIRELCFQILKLATPAEANTLLKEAQSFLNKYNPIMRTVIVKSEEPVMEIEEDFLRFEAANGWPYRWTEEDMFTHITASLMNKKLLRTLYDKGVLDVHDIINITGIISGPYYFKGKYSYDI